MRSWIAGLVLACAAAAQPGAAWSDAIPSLPTRNGLPTLAPLVAQVTPAVVNIAVLQRSPEEQNPLLRDPFFRRFFGLPESDEPQVAAGSGVVVDAEHGYVLTNHHVIQDAQRIVVTLKDNRRFPARLVGSDAGTDIALLKIDAKGLAALPFGDSDALQVGDFVLAIGNPFGLGQTVTSGIVSALGRSGLNIEGYENFIQTDASINPGNSGGALVNLRGELVGINTAIIGPSGGNVGIGFAVPANMARAVMQQLIRFGEVRRGRLGIKMQDLTPELAKGLGVAAREGVAVVEVQAGSPAARAGLLEGDVIVDLDGRPMRSAAELRAVLGVTPPGETVELRVLHGAGGRTLRVRVGEPQASHATGGETIPELAGATFAVVEVEGEKGVLVTGVRAESRAFEYGLRAGDVVVGVNKKRVRSVAEIARALRRSGQLSLNVARGDFLLTIPIR
ncbi:MAG TPA: DegQ family serine endoprotease [Burkholderiales bacterium]|nr:DegQ family serine endoprotease [Burkholderiales bacterium]